MMKNKNTLWLIVIIGLFIAATVHQFILNQNGNMTDKKKTKETMKFANTQLQLNVTGANGKTHRFKLGAPVSVSREVLFAPFTSGTKSTNAFHLPVIDSKTLEFAGQFVGDVNRGGSCNVDILSYVPHGLTHLETSAHVLSPDANPPTVKDIPMEHLSGIVYLIDLTHLGAEPGQQVPWKEVEIKLEKNKLPISMLALKTKASLLPADYNFSDKDFLSLAAETAKGIHDYRVSIPGSSLVEYCIRCLILDLPSIDPERDEGKLLAHRQFFGLPLTGHKGMDNERRAIVELAWFGDLEEGYYHVVITPPRFQANAVSTGIVFQPLEEAGK